MYIYAARREMSKSNTSIVKILSYTYPYILIYCYILLNFIILYWFHMKGLNNCSLFISRISFLASWNNLKEVSLKDYAQMYIVVCFYCPPYSCLSASNVKVTETKCSCSWTLKNAFTNCNS